LSSLTSTRDVTERAELWSGSADRSESWRFTLLRLKEAKSSTAATVDIGTKAWYFVRGRYAPRLHC
jgi:hypothetical protein